MEFLLAIMDDVLQHESSDNQFKNVRPAVAHATVQGHG